MKLTKRTKAFKEKLGANTPITPAEAIKLVKECKNSKFDENVEVVIKLGIDPKKTDQLVRGSCNLPNGTGKKVRILVFARGEKEKEAKDAGADFVGGADLSEKIKGGWFEFDRVIATPDMMGEVGKVGKLLGPRGLMPNPKVGTVTMDVARSISEIQKGQVQFRTDKGGNLHIPIGKISFSTEKLLENLDAVFATVGKMKPSSSKGIFLKDLVVTSTMGPGIRSTTASYIK